MQELKFALIYENYVKNVFICENYERANQIARASLGDNAFAIEVTRYAVSTHDKYDNGIFYHKNEDETFVPAEYIPSSEDKIRELQTKLDNYQSILVLEYENKSSLENKVDELNNTITMLYRKMEVTE